MERNFIPVDDILVEERMRDLDAGMVEILADDISEKGLLQPIGVRKTDSGYVLVFGEHRLAAQILRGAPTIEAAILHINAAQAKVMEIDENILRMPFSPLSFARSLAKRKAIYEEAYPLSKNGAKGLIAANTPNDDDQNDNLVVLDTAVPSFSEDAANRLGVNRRNIERAIWLHKHFDPVAEIILKGHVIMDNAAQLTALAKLDPRDQEIAAKLIADGTYDKVTDAEAHITGAVAPTTEQKSRSKVIESWARASMRVRAGVLAELAGTDLPKGYKIITPESDDG